MIFFIGIILTLFNYDHQTKQIYQKVGLKRCLILKSKKKKNAIKQT
jgi:hypothetical protein